MSSPRVQALKSSIEKAAAGHYYIHIFKKDGKLKRSHIKLSGFDLMFKKDPTFLYVRSLRHAGRAEDLLEYLSENGFGDDSQNRQFLADSYSAGNCEHYLDAIQAEVDNIPVSKPKKKESMSLADIISKRTVFEGFKVSNLKTEAEAPQMVTPKVRSSRNDLSSRLASLDDDKVLDITHFDVAKGTGVKTTKRTAKGSRRPLSSSGELNKVVFDFNKGTDIAVAALMSMGYAADVAANILTAAQTVKNGDLSKIALHHA